jgi:acetylornithine/N-succinyldiaminopimelate aminotransferase
MRARGLLTVTAGDNVVRLLPPLVVGAAQVSEAVGMIEAAAGDLTAQRRRAG